MWGLADGTFRAECATHRYRTRCGTGKSFKLPDQPGNDLKTPTTPGLSSNGTTYLFDVNNLGTEEWVPGTVVLRSDNTLPLAGWRCKSILIVGAGEDGKFYPMVAMPNVDRWLAADEPEGLSIVLDVLKKGEVGIPG